MRFRYRVSPEIRALGLRSIVVAELSGLAVRRLDPQLETIKAEAAAETLRLSEDSIRQNPVLAGYRDLVGRVSRSPAKFPPAAQSLIEIVRHLGRFPLINCAVDAYNVVAAKTFLSLGAHDSSKLEGEIAFRVCRSPEPFTPLGSGATKKTRPGDYVYADQRRVLAWLDSRDCDDAKWSLDTVDGLLVIQGTERTTPEYNQSAAHEACRLVTRFCGGSYEVRWLE